MSADAEDLHRTTGPSITRRTMLKGAAGAGAATLGMGAADQLGVEPVGDADAFAVSGTTLAAVGVTFAVTTAGAIVVDRVLESGSDTDESDVVEDKVYSIATAAANGREAFIDEMTGTWDSASQGNSPFAANAWSEIRVAAAETIANGGTESDAVAAASDVLDRAATRGIINAVERWNTGLKGISSAVALDFDEGTNQLFVPDDATNEFNLSTYSDAGWQNADKLPEPYLKSPELDETILPMDPEKLDNVDEPRRIYALGLGSNVLAPANNLMFDFINGAHPDPLKVQHPELDTVELLYRPNYGNVIEQIQTEHNSIASDLSTYVSQFYQGVEEGAIDISQFIGGRELIREFSGADEQSQLAAQLAASGLPIPKDVGMQAKISHPKLYSDKLWGHLYPLFSISDPPNLKPGLTIPSADYDIAYFGFENQSGEFTVEILSGDSDLTIHDVAGLDDETTVEETNHSGSADENGAVTVWDGGEDGDEDPPDPILYPQDHGDWSVVIDGTTNRSAVDPSKVKQDPETGEWYVPGDVSGLAPGEGIEDIRLQPNPDYQTATDPVADPSNIDAQNQLDQIKDLNKLIEDLREEFDSAGGIGGLLDGFGIPTLPGMGIAGTIAVGIGGLIGLQTLTS